MREHHGEAQADPNLTFSFKHKGNMHCLAAEKKKGSPESASPKKRKRSSPTRESSVSAQSESETDADPAGPQQKKKAVLKYKAPTNKVSLLLLSFIKGILEDGIISTRARIQNACHAGKRFIPAF